MDPDSCTGVEALNLPTGRSLQGPLLCFSREILSPTVKEILRPYGRFRGGSTGLLYLRKMVHTLNRADGNSRGAGGKEAGLCDHTADEGEKRIFMSRKTAESALAPIDAIGENRPAQKLLTNAMSCAQERVKKLKTITSRMRVLLKFNARMRKAGLGDREKLISVNGSYGLRENSRVVDYKTDFQRYRQWISRAKWTTAEHPE